MKYFKRFMRTIRNSEMNIKASHVIIAFLLLFGFGLYTISQRGAVKKSTNASPTPFPAQFTTYIIPADNNSLDQKDVKNGIDTYCKNKSCTSLNISYGKNYYKKSFDDIDFFIINTKAFDSKQQQWLEKELIASKALTKVVIGQHPIIPYDSSTAHQWTGKDRLQNMLCNSVTLYISAQNNVLADTGKIPNCSVRQLIAGINNTSKKTDVLNVNQFSYQDTGLLVIEVPRNKTTEQVVYKFLDKNAQILYPSFEAF